MRERCVENIFLMLCVCVRERKREREKERKREREKERKREREREREGRPLVSFTKGPAQSNLPLPKYPVLFFKPITSLTGPFDPIPVPALAQEPKGLDYECELVAVIGKEARDVPESKALDYVLGYCVGNDVSHREWQIKRGGSQWNLGKGFDGWAPFGPGIVSTKLVKDPQALRIFTKLNGDVVQDSSTKDMVFTVAQGISFLSQGTTLLPGDLIFTGT